MVQNAGILLKSGQSKSRERLKNVAFYLLYCLHFR